MKKKISNQQQQFGQVPRADIPRSSFDLSHGLKTTFDADYLVPMGVWDVIPGDSWNCTTTVVARLATPLQVLQDNIYIDTFFFFVPYRILWDNFEKFMGAQDDPGDSIDYTIPIVSQAATTYSTTGNLWDYFGLPIDTIPNDVEVSSIPWRAMVKIYNDFFRDENLQDKWPEQNGDGPDVLHSLTGSSRIPANPFKRAKRHDYFTSALPWPQKGDPVQLPLGEKAYLAYDGLLNTDVNVYSTVSTDYQELDDPGASIQVSSTTGAFGNNTLYADLSTATAATINELRLAFQTQRLLERDARSGTRYVETLKAHWGVTFPDYTAQRPVYLGGGSNRIDITPVPQTTEPGTATADDAKGKLAGYGYGNGQSGFTKSFVEHGVIIALVNARSDITYSQGIDRYWNKSTRYDFMYPALTQIGEQSILNKELWIEGDATDDDVFGYTGRYNEYRFQNSKLTGLARPTAAGTLASWNLSEEFTSQPTLGSTFIESNTGTPLDRAIAVPTEPHFIADIWHDIKAARPLPLYGDPAGIGRF